jgi:hypothetical protein
VLLLWEGFIEERAFPDWSMAFHEPGMADAAELPGHTDFLTEPLTGTEFTEHPTLAQKLLLSFKRNM